MMMSLQRRLSLTLSVALLLAALVAGSMSFWLAWQDATEAQDELLRQVAVALSATPQAAGSRTSRESDMGFLAEPESRLIVLHFPIDARPAWVPPALVPGLRTLPAADGARRVFVSGHAGGAQLLVAQPRASINDLATDSAARTLIPFLLLVPVQALLIVHIVRAALAPVHQLARRVDGHAAGQPLLVSDAAIPAEMVPFVRAIDGLMGRVIELLQQQRRFIADAAHELRSPLAAIDLQAQNLQRADTFASMRERLPPLIDGIARARRLGVQLLDLAHTQAANEKAGVIDLQALAREVVAAAMPAAQMAQIDLGFERSCAVLVNGSEHALRRILGNAIDNALAYTPRGGQVSVTVERIGAQALLEVADDGPGIATADRARAFDAFVRLPGAPGAGSGLGLSIALAAARALGGELSLHDRRGQAGLVVRYTQLAMPANTRSAI